MEVMRRIGQHEVLVDTSEPCGIYFEESMVAWAQKEDALTKRDILDALANGSDYVPLTLRWEILDRCNFACPFCYIVGHSSNKLIRFSEVRTHLAELVEHGLLFCTLTGGEVTIHPDFKDIFRFLKENGVIVEVFTNGLAINDSLIQSFQEHPPITVEVSLYTLQDARLRQTYGAVQSNGATRVLENVLRMKHAGINVVCKTFLNTLTRVDIEGVTQWCHEHEVEHYSSSEFTQAYDGVDLQSFDMTGLEAVSLTAKPMEKPPVCLPCGTKNYGCAIDTSFSISPCPSIRLDDCTFDLRRLGVTESLRRMKTFMRRFQDAEIRGGSSALNRRASCMAFAKPVRNEAGELLYFAHP